MNEALTNIDASIRHGYAQIGGVRLHYAERGSGGRLVILLHGFPECWYSWRHQLLALGERYTVIAPDMRGYNLSDKPPDVEDYKLNLLIDDVLGLVHHFGEQTAAIVGHDWGAGVSWAVAQQFPEYVWKLAALQVPPMPVWRANLTLRQALKSWYMLLFQIPRVPEWLLSVNDFALVEWMFKRTVARKGAFNDEDIAVYKNALRERGSLTAGINYYRANVVSLFLRARKPKDNNGAGSVRVPTLFIYGEQDHAIVPDTVRNVRSYVDAPFREVRIATSAHWVQNEAAEQVNAALLSFLASP